MRIQKTIHLSETELRKLIRDHLDLVHQVKARAEDITINCYPEQTDGPFALPAYVTVSIRVEEEL